MPTPQFIQPKSVLRLLKAPHPQFLNTAFVDPYAGCELGCLFCYGVDEETPDTGTGPSPFRVGIKTSCPYLTKKELLLLGQKKALADENRLSVGVGFESDPYQPAEKEYQLTRRCLEILKEAACPVQVITKSDLVLRDKAILASLSQTGLAIVTVSLFTLDQELARVFEPRAAAPRKRLQLIRDLRKENILCGAALMPIFPYLTDGEGELEETFAALEAAGALYCVPGILALTHPPARRRVHKALEEKFPKLVSQYEALYDKIGRPAVNYCERIKKILSRCSEKYGIPTVLPVEGIRETSELIVQDALQTVK